MSISPRLKTGSASNGRATSRFQPAEQGSSARKADSMEEHDLAFFWVKEIKRKEKRILGPLAGAPRGRKTNGTSGGLLLLIKCKTEHQAGGKKTEHQVGRTEHREGFFLTVASLYDPWRYRCVRNVVCTTHIAVGHVTSALLYKERSSVTPLSSLTASRVRCVLCGPLTPVF